MEQNDFEIGSRVTVTPDRVAHGGAVVARVADRVVFVRHGIVGETAEAVITGRGPKGRFFFADVVAVGSPSEHRVQHPWKLADALSRYAEGSLPVGGMEYGHIDSATQRDYKKSIVAEQLVRLGKFEETHPALQELDIIELEHQLNWRTRMHYNVDRSGHIMMHPHQSNEPISVTDVPLAHERINDLHLENLNLQGIKRLDVAVSSTGESLLVFTTIGDPAAIAYDVEQQCIKLWGDLKRLKISLVFTAERRGGRRRGSRPADVHIGSPAVIESLKLENEELHWIIGAGGFWQIHRDVPAVLAQLVREYAEVQAGESVYDLYGGAGFFAGVLAPQTGEDGFVVSVEGSPVTSANAAANLSIGGSARNTASAKTNIETVRSDVGAWLSKIVPWVESGKYNRPDVVVLDPSREGAGKSVMEQVSLLSPSRIVYVACDPAALGRDAGTLRELGWSLEKVTAIDMYPGTHHVEAVALFTKGN